MEKNFHFSPKICNNKKQLLSLALKNNGKQLLAAGVGVTLTLLMFEMLLMLGNGFVTPDIAIANCLHKLLTVQIMAHAPTQMHYADAPENRVLEQKTCFC